MHEMAVFAILLVLVRKWVGEGQRGSKFQEFTALMVWK